VTTPDQSDATAQNASALGRCVACTSDEFVTKHWARAPLVTRARGDFNDLLSAAAVDELVSTRGLRTPFARMAKDGRVLDRSKFTRGGGAGASINDQVADDRVLALLDDGATLVLQALHRTWPPLVAFGSALSDELGHPVQINAYITPPQNQGFAPHYDVHDVFVLQVSGRKHWTIHEPVVADPLDHQPWENYRAEVGERAQRQPLIDTVLEPGDALYLPRGTIHSAQALGETSIHLTVGIHPITRYHLVRHLLEAAQHDPALRTSLPAGVDLSDPTVLAPHLAATIEALQLRLASSEVEAAASSLVDTLRRQTRPEPVSPLAQLDTAAALDHGTALRLRTGMHPQLRHGADGITLHLLDRTLSFAADAADAFKTVFGGDAFTPADLPGLDADEQLALAQRLLRAGVVVPVSTFLA